MTIEEQLAQALRERDEAQWHAEGLRAALALVEAERDEARERVLDAALIHAELVRERDEARELNAEWAQKAATWIASPEAAQRLDGYRDLGQQVAEAQRERDEARASVADAYRRGAEAMRVEVMQYLVRQQNEATVMVVDTAIKGVHKLPIPEGP